MSLTVQITNPLEHPDWNERLLGRGGCCFFHTANWVAALCNAYGFAPSYLSAETGDRWDGLLPLVEVQSFLTGRRGVSLPFTDSCPIIASDEEVKAALLKAAIELAERRHWRSVELRCGARLPGDATPSLRYYEHRITLPPGSQQAFDLLKGPVRTAIRKALRGEIAVEVGTDAPAVREFYRLNCLTRRNHGLPPQPYRFFMHLENRVLAAGLGSVAVARLRGQAVAAAVFLHFGDTAHFKYGASDPRFSELRPNNIVMWEGIRWYIERGFRSLDLGRSNVEHEGLRRFKLGWGAEERELFYYKYDVRNHGFV